MKKKSRLGRFLAGLTSGFPENPRGGEPVLAAVGLPYEDFPMLPLRDLVLFPHTLVPLFITTRQGAAALECALRRDNRLFAVCARKNESPGEDVPCEVGTVVRIVQHLKLPDNSYRAVLQGEYRGAVFAIQPRGDFSQVEVSPLEITGLSDPLDSEDSALIRSLQKSFAQYAEHSKKINTETLSAADRTDNAERLCNIICNAINIKSDKKVELLSISDIRERLFAVMEILELESEIYSIQKNISGKVKSRMDKTQREYILQEQLKEINKELGKDKGEDEFALIEKNIMEKSPPEEIMAKARKEIARLKKLQPLSPEAGVLRGYLEWVADLPWHSYSVDSGDLADAAKILDSDHFGMKKPKDRILEFIAVRQLLAQGAQAGEGEGAQAAGGADGGADGGEGAGGENAGRVAVKGPILCFVGPPGTGKTSLGKSVARALGRRFVRISLGGVRDEAEIRGHRKTYVGALPGKIIQSMRKAQTMNPVFLLDEIDKLSSDFRGDPASALLEVLDPEQNGAFTDHYLEVPYDLSKVLFVTTANSLHTIPYPLLDRMEIIEVAGYGENEKLAIAKQFLVPKELKENGLSCAMLVFKDDALRDIIRYWTNESGVRSLEREIARCIRRVARRAVNKGYGKDKPVESFVKTVSPGHLEKLLGRKKYKKDVVYKEARVGVTYALAWTQTGGTVLPVETIRFDGAGDLVITGKLGDVMQESARIALSYLRSCHALYNFESKDISKSAFHIHVPEGAIPKDGPSAGITLASSLLSTLCKVPPKGGIAMTGELTLTGRVLPIGGLKEKILAAIRNGMDTVVLPKSNEPDWAELDRDIKADIKVEFAETAAEVFSILFDGGILKKNKSAPAKDKGKNERARLDLTGGDQLGAGDEKDGSLEGAYV